MTTVNPYFQSGIPVGRRSEQLLYEDLIIECMKIYGFETYYIPRKTVNEDPIFGEDPLQKFEHAYPIEMYMENVMGFEGEGELLTKFGVEIRDTARFVVSRRRWNEVVGRFGNTILELRPAEGDLLYFPLTKSIFEIRKVTGQDPFYQVGKLFVFKLDCELFEYASERIETGVEEIDNLAGEHTLDLELYEFHKEDDTELLLEYYSESSLMLESYSTIVKDPAADNEDFDVKIDDILDFTERNPFGEIYR